MRGMGLVPDRDSLLSQGHFVRMVYMGVLRCEAENKLLVRDSMYISDCAAHANMNLHIQTIRYPAFVSTAEPCASTHGQPHNAMAWLTAETKTVMTM